ncbi:MAG: ABC transporter permease [Chloroflexi bacterium]|nr:ABC transporter permease [Chloroflexota bacterium]
MTKNQSSAPVDSKQEQISQSYWSLVLWKFKKNRMAVYASVLIAVFYIVCVFFAEFFAPYSKGRESDLIEARPQQIQFVDQEGKFHLRPFVYGLQEEMNMEIRKRFYSVDTSQQFPIHFFVHGEEYKLLGLIPMDIHLFGADPGNPEAYAFLLGTDNLGRDLFSRILFGGRVSLFIGFAAVFVMLFLGVTLGAMSGYYGGAVDMVIQRTSEFVQIFPDLPLFLALAAVIPPNWSPTKVFFGITFLWAFIRWGPIARQIRGLVLSLREREYVLAAQSFGASDRRIIVNHLIPGTMSHLIVVSTLAIPGIILFETALSFLGLGLVPPTVSWGTLLQAVNGVRAIRFTPWLLAVVPFVILAILGFNMVGDGLRDAMDPYGGK